MRPSAIVLGIACALGSVLTLSVAQVAAAPSTATTTTNPGVIATTSPNSTSTISLSSVPSSASGTTVGLTTSVVPVPTARPRPAVIDPATSVVGDAERPAPAYIANPLGARRTAAAYAYKWADSTNPVFVLYYRGRPTVPSDNLLQAGRAIEYASAVELDCTNYMSQALRASGFAMVPLWSYSSVSHAATVAWVRASGPAGLAATFVKLGRMRLMSATGTRLGQPPPPGIQIGDIVVWDLNDRGKTMHIDHQLMVTEVTGAGSTWADIRVSYHTNDHRNRAMDEYQTYVAPDAPRAKLYVFHVNYPS